MKRILSLIVCLMMSFAPVSAKSIYLSQTTAYMGVGGTVTLKLKNASGTIKKNTKVYIKNIVFKGSTLYYKVKFGSKTGYIKSKKNTDNRYFRNTPTGM